ncbi:MAG: hypothetical protein U1F00_00990 [Rhodoferax sp.]|jgi:hypothetical protein|nr:hypothetical protein [Rhodoferax sp.]
MALKNLLKRMLGRLGLWHGVSLVRQVPSILRWLAAGCTGAAPHAVKMMAVRAHVRPFGLRSFVETGTYMGDTLAYLAATGIDCASIELSPELHQAARRRFAGARNVRLIEGDSGIRLPEMLPDIHHPVLFWLDGHYSAGVTASAELHSPISAELLAILRHPVKQHVILIDDARCFDGSNGYPHIDELLRVVREDGNYAAEVSIDIIRLIPRAAAAQR